jgi:hypothetical protein
VNRVKIYNCYTYLTQNTNANLQTAVNLCVVYRGGGWGSLLACFNTEYHHVLFSVVWYNPKPLIPIVTYDLLPGRHYLGGGGGGLDTPPWV